MAANLQRPGIARIGKRFVQSNWIVSARDPSPSLPPSRKGIHYSVYDKNLDDQVRPSVVPDDVIEAQSSDKYWAPHPQTGVFGPAHPDSSAGPSGLEPPAPNASGTDSVLEQTVWFRPLEDVDKPPQPAPLDSLL